jgi:hypothetical protein
MWIARGLEIVQQQHLTYECESSVSEYVYVFTYFLVSLYNSKRDILDNKVNVSGSVTWHKDFSLKFKTMQQRKGLPHSSWSTPSLDLLQ